MAEEILISLVVPMYNEADVIDLFFNRIEKILETTGLDYEIICINDGSKDNTLAILSDHHLRNPRIKIINLSRNFGKEYALTAGLDNCSGRAVIPIDADLQDPPELIPELLAKWRDGYDVVYAARLSRGSDSRIKKTTAELFYKFYNFLCDIDIPHNTGDFRLMDQCVIKALRKLPERNRFMKGLFNWVGFRQISIGYSREPRAAGKTKWNYWKLWNFAIDGFTAFSTLPLRVWSYLGAIISLLSFFYAAFLILKAFTTGIDTPGYASLMVVVLFLGGIQLITMGIIGEYLGRMYHETKSRPLYIVDTMLGFDSTHPPAL